jgi:hypothetical protein
MAALVFFHPSHNAGCGVEPERGTAGEHHGINAIGQAGWRQRVQLTRSGSATNYAMSTAPRSLFVADHRHSSAALGVGRVTDHEPKWPEVGRVHPLDGADMDALFEHRRQRVTPFMLQTWQMKVPQPWHG